MLYKKSSSTLADLLLDKPVRSFISRVTLMMKLLRAHNHLRTLMKSSREKDVKMIRNVRIGLLRLIEAITTCILVLAQMTIRRRKT